MAGLKNRNGRWYISFSRTLDGKQERKTLSLRTDSQRRAEELRVRYGAMYDRGEINPFGGWTPQIAQREEQSQRHGTTLAECIEDFLDTTAHVKEATREEYRRRLEDFALSVGQSMPVRLIDGSDIRSYCFNPEFSRATQRTYLRYVRMLFKWLNEQGRIEARWWAGCMLVFSTVRWRRVLRRTTVRYV